MPASGLSDAVTITKDTNIPGAHREVRPAYLRAGFKGGSGSPAHVRPTRFPAIRPAPNEAELALGNRLCSSAPGHFRQSLHHQR